MNLLRTFLIETPTWSSLISTEDDIIVYASSATEWAVGKNISLLVNFLKRYAIKYKLTEQRRLDIHTNIIKEHNETI